VGQHHLVDDHPADQTGRRAAREPEPQAALLDAVVKDQPDQGAGEQEAADDVRSFLRDQ
jgi:hypothetical protein